MKNIILLFLLFFSHDPGAFLSYCMKAFSGKKEVFSDIHNQARHPMSKTLVEAYQLAYELKWFESKKQVKQFSKGLKDMVEFLDRSSNAKEEEMLINLSSKKRGFRLVPPGNEKEREMLNNLSVSVEILIHKTSEIVESVKDLPPEEALHFQKVTQVVFSLFSKHLPLMLKSDSHQVNWSRMNLILQEVANFDSQDPRFSLYKIKRVVRRWYSLKEFILCRV